MTTESRVLVSPSAADDLPAITAIYGWNVLNETDTFELNVPDLAEMLAVIGDTANTASVAVHRALGFEPISTIRSAGWKFERWLDVVPMQKELGRGAATLPGEAPP